MLDVFVVILLSALGQFGALLSIQPGSGAIAFGAVVILTMLAALSFDPRLAWRRAGHRRHVLSSIHTSNHG
jgi:paraquat-inducible protein A